MEEWQRFLGLPEEGGRFVVEYVQTDPDDSPSPGLGHYAGERGYPTLAQAREAAVAAIGELTPEDAFDPCCDWQQRCVVTGVRIYEEDANGHETGWEESL